MLFVNIEFPRRVALGALHKPGWSTALAQTKAGFESTNQDWSNARHSYDVSFAVRTVTDFQDVLEHFHSVRGRAKYFPFKDCLDYRVEQSNGVFTDTDDSPSIGYQLAKRYGSGDNAWDRKITRPMTSPAPVIYRTRSSVLTIATSDATIDYTTGEIQMANHLPGDTYAWSGQFYVPCRYDTDALPAAIVNRNGSEGELLIQCDAIPLVEVRE